MKEMKNVKTKIKLPTADGKGKDASYSDLIDLAVNQPTKEGFGPVEMRARFRIIEVCEKAKVNIKFEDSDVIKVKEVVSAFRGFNSISKTAIEFYDAVEAL